MHIKFHLACSINLFWSKYSNDILLIKLYLYISTCQFPLEFGNLISIMFYNFNFTSIITELHIANQFYIIISYSIIIPCQSYLFVLLLIHLFLYAIIFQNYFSYFPTFIYLFLFINFSQSFILLSIIHFFLYKMIFQCYSIIFLFMYSLIFLIVHHLFYCHHNSSFSLWNNILLLFYHIYFYSFIH